MRDRSESLLGALPSHEVVVPTSLMPDKLAQVVAAGVAIARSLDLDETLQAVVEAAAQVTGASYCALGVLDGDRRISRFITAGMTEEQRALLGALPTGRGILGVLIGEARPLRLRDLSEDPRSVGFPPNHPPMRSFLGVPVEGRGEVFGNLYLTESPDGMFSDEDERDRAVAGGDGGDRDRERPPLRGRDRAGGAGPALGRGAGSARPCRRGGAARAGSDSGDARARPRGCAAARCPPRAGWRAGRVRGRRPLRRQRGSWRSRVRHVARRHHRLARRLGDARRDRDPRRRPRSLGTCTASAARSGSSATT